MIRKMVLKGIRAYWQELILLTQSDTATQYLVDHTTKIGEITILINALCDKVLLYNFKLLVIQ
jgi:hypothetical protein